MNQTLYRKYRPQSFDEVVGQDAVVQALKQSIEHKSLSHAYLFHGTRGTGKTSIARIFAQELGTSEQDIYELDAASHTGVDNIRELRSGVSTRPFNSQYKVYIIDEAHMLSNAAANALLKTLEEPPAHVIFILATTEKHKILDTILSRCVVYDFNSPKREALSIFIEDIALKEGITIDPDAVNLIAQEGEGSYRDTLSVLQKVTNGKDHVALEYVQQLLASSSSREASEFVSALVSNHDDLISVVARSRAASVDPKALIDSSLEIVRASLISRHSSNGEDSIEHITTKHLKDLIVLRQEMEDSIDPEILLDLFVYQLQENKI